MKSGLQSKYLDQGESMSPIKFLKKYFPDSPDWLLGGFFLACLVWLIVLSVETSALLAGNDFEDSITAVFITPLYYPGWALLLLLGFAVPRTSSGIGESIIVLLVGLTISSPMYFLIGALLGKGKTSVGILLLIAYFLLGCLAMLLVAIMFDL